MESRDPGRDRAEPERRPRDGADAGHPRPVVDTRRGPTPALPGGRARPARRCSRARPSCGEIPCDVADARFRGTRSSFARGAARAEATGTVGRMRVVLADPPAYTPPYDHELASALARGRRRCGARDRSLPLRFTPETRRVRARRDVLSPLERDRPVARQARREGVRAPACDAPAASTRSRRPALPVAGRAGARPALAARPRCPARA